MQQPWGGAGSSGGYEFNDIENATIDQVGGRARTWGGLSIVIGALLLLLGAALMMMLPSPIGFAAGAAVCVLALQPVATGAFYLSAGGALQNVVRTSGNDIPHMLDALRKLTNAVRIEAIVSIVGFALGIGLGIFGATK